jgi:hypothetical protein
MASMNRIDKGVVFKLQFIVLAVTKLSILRYEK